MPDVRTRTPRIALVIDRFDGRRGGAALWTRGLAAWLAAHGSAIHVLTRSFGPAEARLPITFHVLDVERSPLSFAAAVAERLQVIAPLLSHDMGAAIGCDLFQPHVGSGLACWQGSVASYSRWLRPIKRLCGLSPRRRQLGRICDAQFASKTTTFLAVSQKAALDMQALHGVAAERICVVCNGVDFSRFAPAVLHDAARRLIRSRIGVGDDEVLLIAVAHHHRLKGVPGLIRSVTTLRREGLPVKLLLCGGSIPTFHRWEEGAAIIRCGPVDEVAPYYAAADVCVHPTYYDACSLVTLEAMASGLPVITTRANGASEMMTPGIDGLVLDSPHDARQMTGAIRSLVLDESLRHSLGAASRRAVQQCSPEKNYREIVAAYAAALALRGIDSAQLDPLRNAQDAPQRFRLAAHRRGRFGAQARLIASLMQPPEAA